MSKLKQKVAVVTGASKGIGAAIAERLAEEGAAVVVNYAKSAKQAEEVVARIKAKGGKAKAIQADVSKAGESKALFEAAEREFGKVDVLVNNAGIYEFSPLGEISEDHYDRQFDLNVKGLVFATQEAVKRFNGNGGSIINISSIVATNPPPAGSIYSATKGAVDTLTKSWAAELGPKKIVVNSVSPGLTETEGVHAVSGGKVDEFSAPAISKTPLGRIGQPRDIANVVAFLASDEAGWVTGQIIPVSGGL